MGSSPLDGPSLTLASTLVTASAAIIFMLGFIHLVFTFWGSKLHPQDPDLQQRMAQDSIRLTRQTTVWKAWVGFNASHGLGVLLFGGVYGYLAICSGAFLFRSAFLLILGLLVLCAYTVLSWRYWFSVPFRGSVLATILYALALVLAWGPR